MATTRRTSPSLTTIRTPDADTNKVQGISSNKVAEGIKEEDTRAKVAVTKDIREEADSKVVEAIIRVAVSEEAVAMAMEISIINKVAVIVVLLQPTRLDSLIGTTIIIIII